MYRILSVLVLLIASLLGVPTAFAEEPAVGTPEEVLVAHYRARLVELDGLLSGVKEREVLMRCVEARSTYRAAVRSLAELKDRVAITKAELARFTSSATTTSQPDPRQTLTALKAALEAEIVSLEAEISAAKAAAADAGKELSAVRQSIVELRTEKARVDAELTRLTGIIGPMDDSVIRRRPVGWVGDYPPIPLPVEFSVCFPQEVGE